MSITPGQPHEHAVSQIKRLRDLLRLDDACERWIIAGSVRRLRPEVHDIDIVAIPRFETRRPADPGLLIQTAADAPANLLLASLDDARRLGDIDHTARPCWGQAKRRFTFEHHVFEFDLCDEIAWPVLVAIRTGPEKFTKGLVTHRFKGGMLPDDLDVGRDREGNPWRVWRGRVTGEGDQIIEAGEQITFDANQNDRQFIELCCGKWIEPKERA